MRRPSTRSLLFFVVVLLCAAQVSWWVIFQVGEASRLQEAGRLVASGDPDAALIALGADETGGLSEAARRRRLMFIMEGAALGLLALVGMGLFYATVLRDQRRREAQDRFLAGATHELQTPLATIRLGLESLLAGSLPPARRSNYMQGMLREVSRLESGVRNLLTAAGLKNSHMQPSAGDLSHDLEAAVEAQGPRAETAEIALEIVGSERCLVHRDTEAMRLVLHNLIDNAIKYSTPGSTVRVALRAAGGRAVLTVSDDGAGIRAEDLDSIFDRFTRGAAARTGHTGGSGLGLYLVREIVHAHGGRVHAHSRGPGKGSTFTLELPLLRDSRAA